MGYYRQMATNQSKEVKAMPKKHYDFAGWATKNDILCSDGRTIRHGAFSKDDGKIVPLVWNHRHDDVDEVLGHALLEERPEGMYTYCSFNGTERGQNAKEMVKHGDIVALSIFANQLKQKGGDVIHGAIKEVSLVLAGANKGALIDSIAEHGEESEETAEIQFVGYDDLEISHAEGEETDMKDEEKKMPEEENNEGEGETVKDVFDTLTDKQKKAVEYIIGVAVKEAKGENVEKTDENVKHSDGAQNDKDEADDGEETIQDVYDSMNEKQKKVVDFLVEKAIEDLKKDSKEDSNEEGGSDNMKHNVFAGEERNDNVISHAEFEEIKKVGMQMGSLSAAFNAAENEGFIQHADGDYGITNIEYLFPDAKTINTTPEFIQRDMGWVDKILNAAHHTPFSRVKSVFANITEDEARARGYIKGKLKKEEVFALLKRTTDPQTIYKKQKLDKNDIDDITDLNVLAWIKAEMQMMLKEETARAFLIGDGRLASSDDKIDETHIRPVYNDSDLFTIKVPVNVAANATEDDIARALIKAMVKSRKQYKGSGNPSFFTTEDYLTDCLLIENTLGERLYKSEAEVSTAMRAKEIIPVEVMEGQKIGITEEGGRTTEYPLMGVLVNFADYNVGTNGGAKTDFFDDFDIDFNQYKYLYETRMSGALIKPYSAISFYLVKA